MSSNTAPKKKRTPRPSKPESTHTSSSVVKIHVADSKDADSSAIVISFPGGLPESVGNPTVAPPKFTWNKLTERTKLGRKVIGQDRHCQYSGHANGLGFDDRRTKIVVGVYDRKRRVVVLHEGACKGTVFAMEQYVPSYLERSSGHVETSPGTNLSGTSQVFEDFGSSKKRKVLKSQAANQVDINNVVGAGNGSAVVQQIMTGTAMSESNRKAIQDSQQEDLQAVSATDRAMEAARRLLLPTYDESASSPDRVYDPKDIAGEKAWGRVYNKVHACLRQQNPIDEVVKGIPERDWSDFALKMVKEVSPDARDAVHRITCTVLANWVVKFYVGNATRRVIEPPNETKATYFGIPVEVAARCIELFTTRVQNGTDNGKIHYIMSKQNKEKAAVHILLLLMMASGSSMKISKLNPIAETLNVPVNDCASFLRYAGCSIAKKGTIVSATLTTPLIFPPPPRRGQKSARPR
jgi:hypothetical protein